MTEKISQLRRQLAGFLRFGLWDRDTAEMPAWQAFLIRQLRVGVIFVRGIGRSRIQLRASAMTFTTLLTLGPVLILALSICQAFGLLSGLQSQLETFLIDNISPGNVDQVRSWIFHFFEGVRSGAFRSLSILVLLGGVLGLLGSIEQSFNDIWGVHRGRPLFQRFAVYTTLVVFGPILIGLSLSLSTTLEMSFLRSWIAAHSPVITELIQIGFRLLPIISTGLAFTLLYTVVPNVHVRVRASLPAGLIAGLIWELSKSGYRLYLHRASHYGTIFGSLAAVPLFLLWVYVSWLVVLFGAQLAFARDAIRDFRLEEGALHASPLEKLRVALHLTLAACRAHRDGMEPPDLISLSQRLRLPLRLVRSVAEDLAEGGVLHLITLQQRDCGLVPARSSERTTTYDVISCLVGRDAAAPAPGAPEAGSSLVDRTVGELERVVRSHCENISLAELLEEQDHLGSQEVLPFPTLEGRRHAADARGGPAGRPAGRTTRPPEVH